MIKSFNRDEQGCYLNDKKKKTDMQKSRNNTTI